MKQGRQAAYRVICRGSAFHGWRDGPLRLQIDKVQRLRCSGVASLPIHFSNRIAAVTNGPTMILISYRRDDSAGTAGRLQDRLEGEFGRDQVFMERRDLVTVQSAAPCQLAGNPSQRARIEFEKASHLAS